jgi:hypothetical protein
MRAKRAYRTRGFRRILETLFVWLIPIDRLSDGCPRGRELGVRARELGERPDRCVRVPMTQDYCSVTPSVSMLKCCE